LELYSAEQSEQFKSLSLEMLKLQVTLREVAQARARGDFPAEQRLLSYCTNGTVSPLPTTADGRGGMDVPAISKAWADYVTEKTAGLPRPTWRAKRDKVARLPANRCKRYPGKTVAELLDMQITTDELPSARTVHEKLVRIGAFLQWCRETKGYPTSDPLAGVHVDSESQSYAAFTQNDLKRLFNSETYERGQHSKSWQEPERESAKHPSAPNSLDWGT